MAILWGNARRMKEGTLPSLGVGYLAAALEERGHVCSLVDAPGNWAGICAPSGTGWI